MDSTTQTEGAAGTNGAAPNPADVAKLRELRARREQLEREREAKSELKPEEQIAVAERALAADEAIPELEAKFGKLGRVIQIVRVDDERDGRAVIVKRPTMTMFRRFVDSDKDESSKELDRFVRPCVVYPDKETFDALVEELPFMMMRCADACAALAGVRKQDVQKK